MKTSKGKQFMNLKLIGMLFVIMILVGCKEQPKTLADQEGFLETKELLATESFIRNNLLLENKTIRTNLTDRKDEYLSESIGLWMEYLLLKNDWKSFDEQVDTVMTYFLTKDNLVIWKIKGNERAPANAFIDDLRIMNALYRAGEQWNYTRYTSLANEIANAISKYQNNDDFMVDYLNLTDKAQANNVTLSYIMPKGLEEMRKYRQLSVKAYEKTKELLLNAPIIQGYWFPKVYHIPTEEYTYDLEVNLIDQFYIGYHRAQWGMDVSKLLEFAKRSFKKGNHKLFGRYHQETKLPVVSYESTAVYALAILMCLELGENEFAKELYMQMKTMQDSDEKSIYYGGYIEVNSQETHAFDNLLALLAERKGLDDEVF